MTSGRILSIETMGLVDGPGIRVVIFFQGCSLRCKYCHNPDSWDMSGGELTDTDTLMDKIRRFRPYFERSGGGVTFSGGEPLLQKEFLLELLKACKAEGIHTCIDTAGVGDGDYDEILKYTDLVLFDVKALNFTEYKKLCGGDMNRADAFIDALAKNRVDTVVRQVVVPDVNDSEEYMQCLAEYIKQKLPTAVKVELLPYHKLGAHKYEKLGIPDPYRDKAAMDKDKTEALYEKYFKGIMEERKM